MATPIFLLGGCDPGHNHTIEAIEVREMGLISSLWRDHSGQDNCGKRIYIWIEGFGGKKKRLVHTIQSIL